MSKSHITKIALFCSLLAALVLLTWLYSNSKSHQAFGKAVPRVDITEHVVALTFDDGPTWRVAALLDVLRSRDTKATFFVVGTALEKHPALARRIVIEGHELGNHSYSHQRMTFKSRTFIAEEIERTDRLIRDAGYAGDIQFRPPYGKKLLMLPYYLADQGRASIMWDIAPDSDATLAKDADKIAAAVLARVRPGSIVLLHPMYEAGKPSVAAVVKIIDGLRQQGYEFVTVSDLLQRAQLANT